MIAGPLQLRVEVQDARDPGLEALPGGGFGIAVEGLGPVAPAELVVDQRHLPGALWRRLLGEDRLELPSERRTLEHHALLAVEPGRARIEVVAADKERPPIHRQRLGVQARARGTEQARVHVAARKR